MEGQSININRWPEANAPAVQPSVYSKGLDVAPPISGKRAFLELKYFHSAETDKSLGLSEQLKKLHEHWREIRRAYPGWLIAPSSSRDLIWIYTSSWINPIYEAAKDLPAHEALLLLRELIWRTDLALAPMMLNEADVVACVLERVNPYPALLDLPDARTVKGTSDQTDIEWVEVMESWVELAFAVAKEARDDLDAHRFERWMAHLGKLRQLDDVWQARWYYEWCLYRLVRMEQREVRKLMKEWPETPNRPEWSARRAAILAELGELGDAERIAEAAFIATRSNLKPVSEDYTLLSLESWILMLLNLFKLWPFYIDENSDTARKREHEKQSYQRRWSELRAYNCDPWNEKQVLELKLGAPMPKVRLHLCQTVRKTAFDLGKVVTSEDSATGPTLENYFPAFSLLILTEQAGYPIHTPGINTFATVAEAAKWIWPMAPLWALSVLLRTDKPNELKEWLSRIRVTTITDEQIATLSEVLLSASEQALDQLPLDSKRNGYSANLLVGLFEVLSRLSFRFTNEQVRKTIELAIRAYKVLEIQQDFRFYESLGNLFERCFYVLSAVDKPKYLLECLSLPIPEADDMQIGRPYDVQKWPEPSSFFIDEEDESNQEIKVAESIVFKLIEVAREGEDEARKRSIWRLYTLQKSGLLTEQQETAFAESLWISTKIDASTGLPNSTGLFPHAFLSLPEAEAGQAEKALKAYLLNYPIPLVVEEKNGQKTFTYGRLEPQFYMRTWINSVPVAFIDTPDTQRRWIEWSLDDVKAFVHKILTWWDTEKAELSHNTFRREVMRQLTRVDEALARIVLSRRDLELDSAQSELQRLRHEAEVHGFPLLLSLPGWSVVNDPTWSEDIAVETLRHALISREPERVSRSVDAMLLWLAYAQSEQLSPPSAKLIDELVNKVLTRRQPSLARSVSALTKVVSAFPQRLSNANIADLKSILAILLNETKLPNLFEIDAEQLDSDAIAFVDRPNLQVVASELAGALYNFFIQEGQHLPPVLTEWAEVIEKSVLPEVRKVAWVRKQATG